MLQELFTRNAPLSKRGKPTAFPRHAVAIIPPAHPIAQTDPERMEGSTAAGGTNFGLFPLNMQYIVNAATDARNVPAY